jgi:hypothetical protein
VTVPHDTECEVLVWIKSLRIDGDLGHHLPLSIFNWRLEPIRDADRL